ncbi:MAG: hypothetical protein SFZ23_13195 [Planctomycetota bacterium]|nr:hypothetical protein [Planctomycetota bacterium]
MPPWPDDMAVAVGNRLGLSQTDYPRLRITVDGDAEGSSIGRHAGSALASHPRGEASVVLDWAESSNNSVLFFQDDVATDHIARLTQRHFTEVEPNVGTGRPLGELPIHLIGHSRGGSVVMELARELGKRGIWIEQLTMLDPHPLEASDLATTLDPVIGRVPANVIFADNYWQEGRGWVFEDPSGRQADGAENYNLNPGDVTLDHDDVKAYYFATIDRTASAFEENSVAANWFTPPMPGNRNSVGFAFSRIAGGEGLRSRNGLHPSFGGLGARETLNFQGAQWPNAADLSLDLGTAILQGSRVTTSFAYGDRDSALNATLFLDRDENPYNDNWREVGSTNLDQADFARSNLSWSSGGVEPGEYRLAMRVTDGGRSRITYARQAVQVSPPMHAEFRAFFPEGFRSDTVNEYIPLVNPNAFPVTYELIARYEFGERDGVIARGTLAPTSRGGVTTTERGRPSDALVRAGVPYALELRASAPLGAILSHYDFDVATGEAFRTDISQSWSFPEVVKAPASDPGSVLDFITLYNPSDRDAVVTWTVMPDGQAPVSRSWSIGALRRGGISIDREDWIPTGRFSMLVTSSEAVIAALSHYEPSAGRGFVALGEDASSSRSGVIPIQATSPPTTPRVVLRSLSSETQQATLVLRSSDASAIETRQVTLLPNQRLDISLATFGVSSPFAGDLTFNAERPVIASVVSDDPDRGDALGSGALNRVATRWLFADAYMANQTAGTRHLERLNLVGLSPQIAEVEIRFLFGDSTVRSRSATLQPLRTLSLDLHEEPLILDWAAANGGQAWFSVEVLSSAPVGASLTHWDLNQFGGWLTLGTPIGINSVV